MTPKPSDEHKDENRDEEESERLDKADGIAYDNDEGYDGVSGDSTDIMVASNTGGDGEACCITSEDQDHNSSGPQGTESGGNPQSRNGGGRHESETNDRKDGDLGCDGIEDEGEIPGRTCEVIDDDATLMDGSEINMASRQRAKPKKSKKRKHKR